MNCPADLTAVRFVGSADVTRTEAGWKRYCTKGRKGELSLMIPFPLLSAAGWKFCRRPPPFPMSRSWWSWGILIASSGENCMLTVPLLPFPMSNDILFEENRKSRAGFPHSFS